MKFPVRLVESPEDNQINFEFLEGSGIFWGTGAPTLIPDGKANSYYFRKDAGASTHIYYYNGSTWSAIA